MAGSSDRDRAINLAKSGSPKAPQAARDISDPFMRCQALAWTARFATSDGSALKLAREAAAAAAAASDAFQAVAGVAWPVGALIERGLTRDAEALLRTATNQATGITSVTSRIDALHLLLQAAWNASEPAWSSVVARLVEAARSGPSEKAQGVLRDVALALAGSGRRHDLVIAAIPEGRSRRQAERRLEAREFPAPRPFFW
jgi:hypothetical protein